MESLRDYKLKANVFYAMKKMKSLRQVEVAEHMIANSALSLSFVKALLYGTQPELLIDRPKTRDGKASSDVRVRMAMAMAALSQLARLRNRAQLSTL